MFRTIRSKLLFSFLIFLFLVGGLITIDIWSEAKQKKIQNVLDALSAINLDIQTIKKLEYYFLNNETIAPQFHETGISENLDKRQNKIVHIKDNLQFLSSSKGIQNLRSKENIEILLENVGKYEEEFGKFIILVKERGFKGYGIEGQMRSYIHRIEKSIPQTSLAKLLMIRRHEKDFIIRKQTSYIEKLSNAVEDLKVDVRNNPEFIKLLDDYKKTFLRLAEKEEAIGFDNKKGQKAELLEIEKQINAGVEKVNKIIKKEAENISFQNNIIQISAVIIISLLIIFQAFYLNRVLSRPIGKLSSSIHGIIESDFKENITIEKSDSKDEIGLISNDVSVLVDKVQSSLGEVKEKNKSIESKQTILMNGVSYAKRIQKAVLPDYELDKFFKKHFVIYRPQYDVSGDFYWFSEINNKRIVAVADCTGKGVAGAFMSMIGNSLLDDIVNRKQIMNPVEILNELNKDFRIALKQDKKRNEDAMDISICVIEDIEDKSKHFKITFAGAGNDLIYSEGWEIKEIKGSKKSIGGRNISDQTFQNESIELKKDNFLYLVTDGLVNQPNTNKERFSTVRLKEILQTSIHQSIIEQEKNLNEVLDEHLKESIQRDDITMLVVKL